VGGVREAVRGQARRVVRHGGRPRHPRQRRGSGRLHRQARRRGRVRPPRRCRGARRAR
jgi:hypothetical protein